MRHVERLKRTGDSDRRPGSMKRLARIEARIDDRALGEYHEHDGFKPGDAEDETEFRRTRRRIDEGEMREELVHRLQAASAGRGDMADPALTDSGRLYDELTTLGLLKLYNEIERDPSKGVLNGWISKAWALTPFSRQTLESFADNVRLRRLHSSGVRY